MAITATAAQNSILMLNVAMFGQAAGTTVMAAALPTFVDGNTYAQTLVTTSDAYKILSPEQAFTKVINNLSAGTGVTAADVEALAKGMVPFVDAGLSVGATINLLTAFLYQNQSLDNVWKNSAVQLLNKTTAAAYYTLDQNQPTASTSAIANVTYRTGTDATSVSFQLTSAAETFVGGTGNDTFYAVAGAAVGQQDQTTLNSGDSMAGGENNDIMYVNMVGNYNGGAMIHGIETLRLGTDRVVTFDYNVNEGQPQVADVTMLVADQINANESLTVNNIIKTNSVLPTLSWENDAATAPAGTFTANYRAAQVIGTTDNQTVQLKNVTNGLLNVGTGIETITMSGVTGTARDTLAQRADDVVGQATTFQADLVSEIVGGNGTNNDSALTKVVLNGSVELGKVGTVIPMGLDAANTNAGFVNQISADDTGINALQPTASNLLSVASSVTEVDASAATAAVNVRFTQKLSGVDTNVTFKGGTANDYVEFERGNVTATGGTGDDTFAFNSAKVAQGGFTSQDVLTGGTGTDTVRLGLNGGAGGTGGTTTYVLNTTEFNNKTGIDVLDLRGTANTVVLADAFVSSADAATFIVRTDKIAQASDTSSADSATTVSTLAHQTEAGSNHTIDITKLAENRGINIIGGTGTDRIIGNNASINQNTIITAGTNSDNGNVAGSYRDSLVLVDGGVYDQGDLSNITGIDIINLVESVAATNKTFNLTLTETFLRGVRGTTTGNLSANTLAISTGAAATATGDGWSALNAGDTVNIDITDLIQGGVAGGALKTSVATSPGAISVAGLNANGATVNFVVGGVTLSPAQVAALNILTGTSTGGLSDGVAIALNATAQTGTAFNDTVTGTFVAGDNITTLAGNDTFTASTALAAATGTLDAGAGAIDTLNLTSTAATMDLTAAQLLGFEVVNFGGVGGTADFGAADAAMTVTYSNTSGATELDLTATNFGATVTATSPLAGNIVIKLEDATNTVNVNGTTATGNISVTGGTGADTINAVTLAATDKMDGGAGTDVLTLTGTSTFGNASVIAIETIQLNATAATATLDLASYAAGIASTVTAAGSTQVVTIDADSHNEAVALTIIDGAGADKIMVSGTDANRAKETVTLSTGGADTVTFNNAAINNTVDSNLVVNNFTTGLGGDKLVVTLGGTAVSAYQNITAAGSALTTGGDGLIVINSGVVELLSPNLNVGGVDNSAAVKGAIAGAVGANAGAAASYNFHVVLYGNGNAYLYDATIATNADVVAGDITAIEYIGVLNGVAANTLVSTNFV